MQQESARPAFVFTEAPGEASVSQSTYENEDGIFFVSVYERPSSAFPAQYLVYLFNMAETIDSDGSVFILPWAELLCSFTPEWIAADPEVNLVESAEDSAMNWLDAEDVAQDARRHLVFTEDEPEGEEHDYPGSVGQA